MATLTDAAFRKVATTRAFAPVYYLYGDDDFRKEEAVNRAVSAAVAAPVRELNIDSRKAAALDAEALESLLGTPPMLSGRRAIVLRDVGSLRKDARRVLDQYLDHPADDALLLLVSPAGEPVDRALLALAVGVEFDALKGEHLPKWIARRAATLGATITPEASGLLQAAVGTELTALASELDKLASYVRGSATHRPPPSEAAERALTIDEAAVAEVVGVRRGETMGDFLDRVAERDVTAALDLIEHVLAQPRTTAVSVVIGLAVQTLALGWGVARRARGIPRARLEGEFRTLLQDTGAYPMRPWKEAQVTWARAVDRWSETAVEHALDALLAADVALKDTRVSSDEQILASLVLAMCATSELAPPSGPPPAREPDARRPASQDRGRGRRDAAA